MYGIKYKDDVLMNQPEGKAMSDTELDTARATTEQQVRNSEAKDLTDSYGIGSAIGDALLHRAGFGTPIRDYKGMQETQMRDRWTREDKTNERVSANREKMFKKRLHDGITAVADPNSPFYGDLSYMQDTVNEPSVRRNLGIQGRWTAQSTGKKDPNTGLPVYQISDIDPKSGKVYQQTQATAQQVIDSTLGQMNPDFQKEMAEGIAASAVQTNNKIRMFNHFKDIDPDLAEYAAGMKQDPIKAKLGMFNKFTKIIKEDPRFKDWTVNDAATAIFGKRLSEDRYKFVGTDLVEDPNTGDAGLKVYDKIQKRTRVIPIDGYSYDKYKKDMIDLYGAKKEAGRATKDLITIGENEYTPQDFKALQEIHKGFGEAVKAYNDSVEGTITPMAEPSIEVASKYYELIKNKGNREMLQEAMKGDPEAMAASAALLKAKGAQQLIPLIIPQSK